MESHENLGYDTSSVYTSATVPVIDEEDSYFTITAVDGTSIQINRKKSREQVEYLSIHAAESLKIDPIAVHLLALKSFKETWIPPGRTVYADGREPLILRVRYFCNIFSLSKESHAATEYLYKQMRRDFIKGHIRDFHDGSLVDQDPAAIAKGLAVMDMVCHMKEKGISAEDVSRNWRDFLPKDLVDKKQSRGNITEFLHNSYRKNVSSKKLQEAVEKRWKDAEHCTLHSLRDDYVKFLSRCITQYFCEDFECRIGLNVNAEKDVVRVNPSMVVKSRPNEAAEVFVERKDGDDWKLFFRVHDIHDVSLMMESGMCQLNRVSGQPFYLRFSNAEQMESFVTLLDAYRRFTGKFYFNICAPLASPFLAELKATKCHGPCDRDITVSKLVGKPAGTFTVSRSPSKFALLRLDYVAKDKSVKNTGIIACNMNGHMAYRLASTDKWFSTLQLLLDYYCSNQTADPSLFLTSCLRPHEDDRFALKLFIEAQWDRGGNNPENQSLVVKGFVLPSSISHPAKQLILRGHHSSVRKGNLNTPQAPEVAIKILDEVKVDALQQLRFLSNIREFATATKTASLVKYYGILSLDPVAVVLEYAPLNDLRNFLHQRRHELSMRNLLDIGCQMAMAVWSLESEGCFTGPLLAKRVFVFEYSGPMIRVKLGPLNLGELVHWRGSLESSGIVDGDNSWDYGTFLWELFTFGAHPLPGVSAKDSESLYLNGYRLDCPTACPKEIYHKVMEKCWDTDLSLRPSRSELMRDMNQFQARHHHEDTPIGPAAVTDGSMHNGSSRESFLLHVTGNCIVRDLKHANGDGFTGYDPWLIEESSLRTIERLGEGRYGEVNKAWYTDPISPDAPPRLVAVKQLKQIKCDRSALAKVMEEMRGEMEIMKSLQHENIVEIIGICADPVPLLVMQYCENGALSFYLRQHKDALSVAQLKGFAKDVACGMKYLQSKEIVHRDLAARNILVLSDLRCVISDFGLARFLDTEGYYLTQNYGRDVPLAWYAPEVILHHKYSPKSDTWSYGVLLFEIFSFGEAPYFCQLTRLAEELLNGKRLGQPKGCPDVVYAMMRRCWEMKPEDRPDFRELHEELSIMSLC